MKKSPLRALFHGSGSAFLYCRGVVTLRSFWKSKYVTASGERMNMQKNYYDLIVAGGGSFRVYFSWKISLGVQS